MSFCLQSIRPVRTPFRGKFISAAMPAHPGKHRLGESPEQDGEKGGAQTVYLVPAPRCSPQGGWVSFLFYFS